MPVAHHEPPQMRLDELVHQLAAVESEHRRVDGQTLGRVRGQDQGTLRLRGGRRGSACGRFGGRTLRWTGGNRQSHRFTSVASGWILGPTWGAHPRAGPFLFGRTAGPTSRPDAFPSGRTAHLPLNPQAPRRRPRGRPSVHPFTIGSAAPAGRREPPRGADAARTARTTADPSGHPGEPPGATLAEGVVIERLKTPLNTSQNGPKFDGCHSWPMGCDTLISSDEKPAAGRICDRL